MSKKDFIRLAAAIKTITNIEEREEVAAKIADVCRDSCEGFSYDRFYTACGV